jgi:hypothetical protein
MCGKINSVQKFTYFPFLLSLGRYTSSNDEKWVYAFILVWPKNSNEVILDHPVSFPSTVVDLLGFSGGPLPWHAANKAGGIIIDVSSVKLGSLESDWTWVFKLENVSYSVNENNN